LHGRSTAGRFDRAVNGLTVELIEDHLRRHVVAARSNGDRTAAAEELIDVVRTYLK
jgi:DNA-binding FrmR family transcriptional regulator